MSPTMETITTYRVEYFSYAWGEYVVYGGDYKTKKSARKGVKDLDRRGYARPRIIRAKTTYKVVS